MRVASMIVAVWCAGCDYVLGLQEHLDAPPPIDASPDAYFACEVYKPLPTKNDSDRDGVTDDLDNCPNVANDTQLDMDGDKVGNDCDARPSNPADCIIMFFDFATDPLPVFTEAGGMWQWAAGVVEQKMSSVALAYLDMPIMQPSISVVVSGIGGNNSEVGAYLITGDVTNAQPLGVTCTYQPLSQRLLATDLRSMPPYSGSQNLNGNMQPVIVFAWAETDSIPFADCGVKPSDAGRNTEGTNGSMRVPARVGFFTDDSIAKFHSVAIYGVK